MRELPVGSARDGDLKIPPYGRFVIATAGTLAVTGTFSCAIVLAMSVLLRGNGLTHGFSTLDPMVVAIREPTVDVARSGKSARLAVSSSGEELTADAIVAAYRRTLMASTAGQSSAPAQVSTTTVAQLRDNPDPAGTEAESASENARQSIPDASNTAIADASAQVDKLLPLPRARPAFEQRHVESVNQDKPTGTERSKTAPAANQLADLQGSTSEAPSKRSAPDASTRSSFAWPDRSHVAVYDISAGVVYLPDGERLEAHSGVGRMRDNPSFVNVKMLGPTPPATYALSMREQSFHGVDAIRLTPVKGTAPFGRDGLLAHTYMLRRPGDSNGCVVFANYNRFLKAFRNNEVNYMVVVPQMQDRLTWLASSPVRG